MKMILMASLCVFSMTAFAEEQKERFEEMKKNLSSQIEERIGHLQEAKSCVNAATDREALKACREKMKEHRKEMREDWQKKKQEWKSKRKS